MNLSRKVRVPQDCSTLQEAVTKVHKDDRLTTIVLGKGEHKIGGYYLHIHSTTKIVGDPGVPKSEIVVVGGIRFNRGIPGNCHLQHLTLRQAKERGVAAFSSFTMNDVLVEQCRFSGVYARGTGVLGRCTNVEVRQCGRSGVSASNGASITLIGAKTTVHHNCTKEYNSTHGLAVVGSSSSRIQLIYPLTKETVSTDNGDGRNWGAWNGGDINQIYSRPSEKDMRRTLFGNMDDNETVRKVRVLSAIPSSVLETVFGWGKEDAHQGALLEAMLDFSNNTAEQMTSWNVQKMFLSIAHNMFRRIPVDRVVETYSTNPFVHWTRVPTSAMLPFRHKSGKRSKYPKGKTKPKGNKSGKDIAYIVNGYGDKGGSFSDVHPFVVYDGKTCILKIMEISPEPLIRGVDVEEYLNARDVFELVTQVYLHEAIKKHGSAEWAKRLSIPEILYVQRITGSNSLHVCMRRAKGEFLRSTKHPFMALAYIMKALWFLQDRFHFMHRDFHSGNVAYDPAARRVEIIDFGYACVNPEDNDVAWQANVGWYPTINGSNAATCTNRSYDACVLLSSMYKNQAELHAHCVEKHREYHRFIVAIKNEIREKISQVVKQELRNKKKKDWPDFNFTGFDNFESPDWQVGNNSRSPFHFMYDLNEFQCEDFYPERVVQRLLRHIPLVEWHNLQKGWKTHFDQITKAANISVLILENNTRANIIKCTSNGKIIVRTATHTKKYNPEELGQIEPYECT